MRRASALDSDIFETKTKKYYDTDFHLISGGGGNIIGKKIKHRCSLL